MYARVFDDESDGSQNLCLNDRNTILNEACVQRCHCKIDSLTLLRKIRADTVQRSNELKTNVLLIISCT